MKALEIKTWLAATGLAAVLCAQAFGQHDAAAAHGLTTPEAPRRLIVVSLEDRKLALIEDGKVLKTYAVAVGKSSTPSPVGTYTIERRIANPTYSHNGKTVPPGPGNPVGTRWMGLSIHGYGIHGTNEPKSIGRAASHGCIRMAKANLEEFYGLVRVGDTVELIGQRNEETAELFGQPPAQPSTETVETASNEPAIPEALRADVVADSNAASDATANLVEVR